MQLSLFWLFALHLPGSVRLAVDDHQLRRLSSREKEELLDTHNYLRSVVDPPATNMQRMVGNVMLITLTKLRD